MYVTYLELYDKCKKVFEAWGVPDGCREDCAELITWSECVGYSGLQNMLAKATDIQVNPLENIRVEDQSTNESYLYGNQLPDILLAKLGVDFLKSAIQDDQPLVQLHVFNSTPSILLAYESTRIAKGAMGGLVHWKEEDQTYLAYATPGDVHPTILILKGEQDVFRDEINTTEEYVITAFQDIDTLHQTIEKVKADGKCDRIISYEKHHEKWNESRTKGILIDPNLWEQVSEEAKKVLL